MLPLLRRKTCPGEILRMPAVKSAVILAPWKNKYNPPQTYTSAVPATEHTNGCALKVWAAIQMINGLAS